MSRAALLPLLLILSLTAACGDQSTPQVPDSHATPDGMDPDASADLATDTSAEQQPTDTRPPDALVVDSHTPDALPADTQQQQDAPEPDAALPESDCSDGKDNDGDGKVDCLDSDCAGKTCRVTIGFCDAEETCVNNACPADSVKPKGTVCRPGNSCDIEEKCDGVSNHCPPDLLALPSLICRAPSGPCDHAETCDGVTPTCPPDLLESKGVVCRSAAGPCDAEEVCDGLTDGCPADALVPASAAKVCRAKAGPCDLEELCDGTSSACPKDLFVPSSAATVCRPVDSGCDLAESCDGKGPACPADLSACTSNQYCWGGACVAKQSLGTTCVSDTQCLSGHCENRHCCDRDCSSCEQCDKAGALGTCTTVPAGAFPPYIGAGVVPCYGHQCDGSGNCLTRCATDTECRPEFYCDLLSSYRKICKRKKYPGRGCRRDPECKSGTCAIKAGQTSGICCKTTCPSCCGGDCTTGTCKMTTPVPANTDAAACGSRYSCDGNGGVHSSCSADAFNCSSNCSSNAWCWQNKCVEELNPGAACLGACQCKSNVCLPFVCW